MTKLTAFLKKSWYWIILGIALIFVLYFMFRRKQPIEEIVKDFVAETKTKCDIIDRITEIKTTVAKEKKEEVENKIKEIQKEDNEKKRLEELNKLLIEIYRR